MIAFTAVPSHAQLIFQFDQTGGGTTTTVTGSGSGTTGVGPQTSSLGFVDDPVSAAGPLFVPNFTPPTWVQDVMGGGVLSPIDAGSSLMVGPSTLNRLWFQSDNFGEVLFLQRSLVDIPSGLLLTASGTATFNNPYTSLFANYAPGTVLVIIPNTLHFIINGNLITSAPTPAARGGRQQAQTVYLVDAGAMNSLEGSGLLTGLIVRDLNRSAAYTATRGVNDRLKRAQSRGLDSGQETAVTTSNNSSLLRYLAFVGDENVSYKVALGLADAEERTFEVNMVDTLSAQTGTNLNGQSLSGGLPYAMMGVPMMPMAGGVASVNIVEAAPSGKTVIDDSEAVVESAPWKRWELFVAGDFSLYDQDPLGDMMEGFDTETYAGSVGLEYRVKEWLNLGMAWSYMESDTNMSANLGDIDLDGNVISGYATAFWKQNWADLLYSYGSFNNDIRRNTGLGSTAQGDTDAQSHNVRLNIGRNIQMGDNILHGPIAGLRYANGDVDPYSERGGGTAAINYNGTDFESMVSRVGWQASHVRPTGWGRIVSQVHLAWEHEFMPENGTVGASLQTSPFSAVTGGSVRRFGGFSSESDGAHPGTDWMAAGAGLRFELDNGFALRAEYEGIFFRSSSSQHYGSAKLSYEW